MKFLLMRRNFIIINSSEIAMKKHITKTILLLMVLTLFSSCDLVEGIFKAGMGVGIFLVILVVGLIIWIISKVRSK